MDAPHASAAPFGTQRFAGEKKPLKAGLLQQVVGYAALARIAM
jgi:hypothetical protein